MGIQSHPPRGGPAELLRVQHVKQDHSLHSQRESTLMEMLSFPGSKHGDGRQIEAGLTS